MKLPKAWTLTTALGSFALVVVSAMFVIPFGVQKLVEARGTRMGFVTQAKGVAIRRKGIFLARVGVDVSAAAAVHVALEGVTIRWRSLWGTKSVVIDSAKMTALGSLEDIRKALIRGDETVRGIRQRSVGGWSVEIRNAELLWRESKVASPNCGLRRGELVWSRGKVSTLNFGEVYCSFGLERASLREGRLRAGTYPRRNQIDVPESADLKNEESPSSNQSPWHLDVNRAEFDLEVGSAKGKSSGEVDETVARESDATVAKTTADKHADEALKSLGGRAQKPANRTSNGAPAVMARSHNPAASGSTELRGERNGSDRARAGKSVPLDQAKQLEKAEEYSDGKSSPQRNLALWRDALTLTNPGLQKMLELIPASSRFEIVDVRARFSTRGQKLDLGPWTCNAASNTAGFSIVLADKNDPATGAFQAKWTFYTKENRSEINLSVTSTTFKELGVEEGDWGMLGVDKSRIALSAIARIDAKDPDIAFDVSAEVSNLSFRQPWLAANALSGVDLAFKATGAVGLVERKLVVSSLDVTVGRVSAHMQGSVDLHVPPSNLELDVVASPRPCADYFSSIPPGLAPLVEGWKVNGQLGLSAKVSFNREKFDASKVSLRLDNRCHVVSTPAAVATSRFARPFVLELDDETNVPRSFSFGPGSWNWTPLAEISPYVESAVLVCEDGRFLRHNGLDIEAIQNSIRENLRSGRFARGGSTVSMQLAKNLYLRRDKTLSRKLQEAALTILLEQSFSKRELLELYLNVIEFGPGVYGISQAARHHFDTTPDKLTLAQAYFLISLLPNPKVSHFGADGAVTGGRLSQLHQLMRVAAKRGHITQEELEVGLSERPAFRVPGKVTITPSRRMTGEVVEEDTESEWFGDDN